MIKRIKRFFRLLEAHNKRRHLYKCDCNDSIWYVYENNIKTGTCKKCGRKVIEEYDISPLAALLICIKNI